ncbi:hypothetical protein L7F22_029619 [Adiantum nelumboides]|nr:hypothetical protein [Adiantum nelumboides]
MAAARLLQREFQEFQEFQQRRERERDIYSHLEERSIDSAELFDKLVESGKPISELLLYAPELLEADFQMDHHVAVEFLGGAKKPRHSKSGEDRELDEAKLAYKCFRVPYKGDAHRELYKQVSSLCKSVLKETHYSPYAALVQSSGTGKSRALMEMSKVGVYVCYCSLVSSTSTAVPPRTGGLADKLVTTFDEGGMVLYLKAWLQVLAAKINDSSPEEWMKEQLPSDSSPADQVPLADQVLAEWKRLETEPIEQQGLYADRDDNNFEICSDAITSVEEGLRRKCTQCSLEQVCAHYALCSVIFAFDEARGLQVRSPRTQSMSDSPFYQVRRALRIFFGNHRFFAVMLDTSAKVTNLLPSKNNEDSERAIRMGFRLTHPIYFLPTMGLFKNSLAAPPECYESVHWVKHGRPMWASRLGVDGKPENVRRLALQKLVHTVAGKFQGKDVDVLGGKMTESQAMALLSAAAGLSICSRCELAEVMAASHMELILRVSEDRSRIFVGFPAEPILAEAAAYALVKKKVQEGALTHLFSACKNGYVTPGPRGEFVAKFILVAATWDSRLMDWQLRKIPLATYLERLLSGNSQCDANMLKRLKDECPDGYVFFNSFVLVRHPPTTATLEHAHKSGYALMYRAENNLPGVDLIIPVWTRNGMTYFAVSVKNLKHSGWLEEASTDKVRMEFTNVQATEGIRCITLVMSLRELVNRDKENWVMWASRGNKVASDIDPYINLTSYGIDHNFNFLSDEVKNLLKLLLITVFDELTDASEQEKEWIRQLIPEQFMTG